MRTRLLIALAVLGLALAGPAGIPSASGMGDPTLSRPSDWMTQDEKIDEASPGPESYEYREPVETGALPAPEATTEGRYEAPVDTFEMSEPSGPGTVPLHGGDGPAREEIFR